mmetsp:Transcript_13189/g.46224  ORF Transcript_13189/g.46224 Transcript_13189/m.46224 type:complete len:83 (+) Transcript_13189:391-639(+)
MCESHRVTLLGREPRLQRACPAMATAYMICPVHVLAAGPGRLANTTVTVFLWFDSMLSITERRDLRSSSFELTISGLGQTLE